MERGSIMAVLQTVTYEDSTFPFIDWKAGERALDGYTGTSVCARVADADIHEHSTTIIVPLPIANGATEGRVDAYPLYR